TKQLATRDTSGALGTFRPSATCSGSPVASSRAHSGVGGATTASEMSTGEEGDRDMAAIAGTTAERNAVRRARETAELERSELRRRHDVEMSAKQSRIERLKLEVRKLEAERDGLKQAAETQVGLFRDGYAELKTYLEDMKAHGSSPPPPTSRRPSDSCSEEQARSGGDGRATIRSAEGRERWMQTMLATEEGLNCQQVRMLQGLLLEAVSAATPTVVMPAAVTQAVDSIRQGLGLPPLVHSPERAPVLRGMPCSSSSRHPAAATATATLAESMHSSSDLETAGCGPHRGSGFERHFRQGPRGEFPTQDGPPERGQQTRHYHHHHQIHGDRRPSGLVAAPDATSPSSTAGSTSTDKRLVADTMGGNNSPGKFTGRNIRPDDDGDDDRRSCAGSEGSGTLWVRVAPTDDSSSVEEDLNSPSSQASYRHHGVGPGASRWRGRDDILERYLAGGKRGVPNEKPETEGNQPSHELLSSPRACAAGGPAGGRRSSFSDTDRPHSDLGEETHIRNASGEGAAGAERGSRRNRMLGAELAASGGAMSAGSLAGMRNNNASDTRPCVLDVVDHDGSPSGDGKCTRIASNEGWGGSDRLPAGAKKAVSNEFDGHR
ncbi:unnamed protein product, partial [Ectocarpus fasciculatus]